MTAKQGLKHRCHREGSQAVQGDAGRAMFFGSPRRHSPSKDGRLSTPYGGLATTRLPPPRLPTARREPCLGVTTLLLKLTHPERTTVLEATAPIASFRFLLRFVARLVRDEPGGSEAIDGTAVKRVQQLTLNRICQMIKDESLSNQPDIIFILFQWADIAGAYSGVQKWTVSKLKDDCFVIRFAREGTTEVNLYGFNSEGRGEAMQRFVTTLTKSLTNIVEWDALLRRVDEVVGTPTTSEEDKHALSAFKKAAGADRQQLGPPPHS
jgi:hypothetical protein